MLKPEKLAAIIIVLLILADLVTGLLFNLESSFYRVGLIVKSGTILFTLFLFLPLIRKKSLFSVYLTMAILFVLWMSGSLLSVYLNPRFEYVDSLIILNRYLLFFILSCVFISLKDSSSFTRKCKSILEFFFLVNNSMILLGFVFKIDLFLSYPLEEEVSRFGYKGLIYGTNEVAGIYILGTAYFFREKFKHNQRKGFLLLFTCLADLLTGTKATMLGLVFLAIYYFVRYRLRSFFLFVIPMLTIFIFFIKVNWTLIQERYLAFIVEKFKTMDILTFLMSGRNLYVVKNFEFIDSHWSMINYLTGDGFLYSETDFLDLYFFFGVGCFLYLYLYMSIFFIKDTSKDNYVFFIILLFIAFTAGHIIQSAAVPVFLLLFIFSNETKKIDEVPGHHSAD
jgi:hypothetical protein